MSPTVSVIVVSRGRPESLRRTLFGLSQLCYEHFEIIVVADKAGCDAVRALPMGGNVALILFEKANISAARNRGIAEAAGEIIAFIDDDAVPEPNWLTELTAAFVEKRVAAVGGYVIGRNGFSFQWKGRSVDRRGRAANLNVDGRRFTIFDANPELATKTEGTNCAFRRNVLMGLGGFDPAFCFYNDETDLNMRLAQAGYSTALCPSAVVHHGFAASARRRVDRVPTTLFDVGASIAVYLRKFASPSEMTEQLSQERLAQKKRLDRFIVNGQLALHRIKPLLESFDTGVVEGRNRPIGELPAIPDTPRHFNQFPSKVAEVVVLSGRWWQKKALKRQASDLALQGKIVKLYVFSYTCLYHQRVFVSPGYWLQTGGVFGRSNRTDPLFQYFGFQNRVKRETEIG